LCRNDVALSIRLFTSSIQTSTNVNRNKFQWTIQSYVLAIISHRSLSIPIIPSSSWKVSVDRCLSLSQCRADQYGISNEELRVNSIRIRIARKLKEEWPYNCCSGSQVRAGKQSVIVRQQWVTYVQYNSADIGNCWPYIQFLRSRCTIVVISTEGIESANFYPASAKFYKMLVSRKCINMMKCNNTRSSMSKGMRFYWRFNRSQRAKACFGSLWSIESPIESPTVCDTISTYRTFCGIPSKATYIGSYHRNSKQVEVQHIRNSKG
jgi:hypothetical protein